MQLARLGVRPLLLDRSGQAGGLIENAFRVENYPGPEEPPTGAVFTRRLREWLARFEVPVERAEVCSLERGEEGYVARCEGGALEARAVVLAPGTTPVKLGIAGEAELQGSGVFYEVRQLLPRSPARVVVIGAGEAAFDYSLSLARAGARVEVCIRGEEPAVRGHLAELVGREGAISVRRRTQPLELERTRGGVLLRAVSSEGQVELSADAVLVAVGRRSEAPKLLAGLGLSSEGELRLQPKLFVVGDARLGTLGQVGMAVGDGLRAAQAVEESLRA